MSNAVTVEPKRHTTARRRAKPRAVSSAARQGAPVILSDASSSTRGWSPAGSSRELAGFQSSSISAKTATPRSIREPCRARRAQVIERADAARDDHVETERAELLGTVDVGTCQLAVARDLIVNDRADTESRHSPRELLRGQVENVGRASRRDAAILRVDADGESRRPVARDEPLDERAVNRAARADDDTGGAEREHLIDVELPKQTATDLYVDGGRLEHCADERVIVRASVRAVHVDQMDPVRAGARECVEGRERLGHGAVGACDAPAFYVDGGIELHGICC